MSNQEQQTITPRIICVPLTEQGKDLVNNLHLNMEDLVIDLEKTLDLALYFCKRELEEEDIEHLYITHCFIEEMKKVKQLKVE